MIPIKKLTGWFDRHILEILSSFLLVFIPLYPKWPLADVLPGYIVRMRLEDLLIAFTLLVYLIQLWRKKVSLKKNPLTWPIALYLLVGFLSSLSAIFISHTVPMEKLHLLKLFFHWFRRIEYMSLALVFFSAVKTGRQLKRIITIMATVAIILTLYGYGQKYLEWPVYSTMNREYSKGWRLVLTEHARVPSTFAGHYDFAAYTVISLSLILSVTLFSLPVKKEKLLFSAAFVLAFTSLLLTASRTSFIAYVVAVTFVIFLLSLRKGIKWGILRWSGLALLSLVGMFFFQDLSQRFAHVIRIDKLKEYLNTEILKRTPGLSDSAYQLSDDLSLIYTATDQPPVFPETLPPDVYQNFPEAYPEATLTASADKQAEVATLAGKPRTYSPAAFTFGLSSAIRFDALWPKAIQGFKKNPLFGSGYSTLIKNQVSDFTEAESTDNDYLRALGETGILGFVSFYGIFAFTFFSVYQKRERLTNPLYLSVVVGILGALIGLLVNAAYIDVFEASKVAYTLWALLGILFATLNLSDKKRLNEQNN